MTLTAMEDSKSIQKRFEAAVKVIRSLPQDGSYDMSDDMLVIFYSYYKQATEGPCYTLKPNSWDPIGEAKWEAWKALGNMSKGQAMMEYVQEIQLIIETLPVTDRMEELMDALDPFYEIVDDEDVVSKAEPLFTGSTIGEEADEEGEGESKEGNLEDYIEFVQMGKDSSNMPVFVRSEENSISSLNDDTHSSLNTAEEEEELVYDDSDDEMDSQSMEKPATPEKGPGVLRVHLADMSVVGANMQHREPPCGSQDGKPQGLPPRNLGTVQTDRISACSGREHSCQGDDGQRGETADRMDKQAFNTQISTILSQLEDNMQDVLHRLTTLEHLTASQAQSCPIKSCHSKSPKKRLSWWPLNSSSITAVLTVLWPFAVHWLVQFYLQRRKRRWLNVK